MKQTAIEFLLKELKIKELANGEQLLAIMNICNDAKQMEIDQMLEFWNGGINATEEGGKSFDQYYNENYRKKK